jgi:hypothetical protein
VAVHGSSEPRMLALRERRCHHRLRFQNNRTPKAST